MASSLTVVPQACFSFLHLPAEVRNRIYYHALSNFTIHSDNPWSLRLSDFWRARSKSDGPSISLLLTCNQVYNEASYILYQYGHLQIHVVASNYPTEVVNLSFDIGKRYARQFNLVKNLQIEIGWKDWKPFLYFSDGADGLLPNPSSKLPALCDAIANLCHLKTIRIRWFSIRDGMRHVKAKQEYCRWLLQPVCSLRARFPGLRIEIETGQRMCQYGGGQRKSWDSVLELEEYMAKELADSTKN